MKETVSLTSLSRLHLRLTVPPPECTVKALTHRIAKIKISAKEYWPDDVAATAANAPPPQTKAPRKRKTEAAAGDADADDDASAATPGSTAKKARTAAIKNEDDEAAAPSTPTKKGRKAPAGGRKKKADTAVAEAVIKTEKADGTDKHDVDEVNGDGNGVTAEADEKEVEVGADA